MPHIRLTDYVVHPLLRAHDWQHRPQLDDVCQWWRDGGRGVMALVGMGGAGKTAIAERFLRVLPGGLPIDPDIPKDGSLPKPHGLFVFSFYDAPNPEAFFEALQMWLDDSAEVEKLLSLHQLFFKLQRASGLLVLDGLEKVQEDGVRGLLGRLASPKLREFLDRIAAGYLPELSVLVTSRFPLADLRDARPQYFHSLTIDEIELPAGIRLLRARGVRGTDPQLAHIVDACGRHALTVDFAGGYIAEFGGGDPTMHLDFKMDSAQLRQQLGDEPDDARRHVLKQGYRFARLAERYRDSMLGNTSLANDGDAAALALLERICLFRLGVAADTLANIFTGEQAVKVSGPALASLTHAQLQKKLDWLVRMRIVEKCVVRSVKEERNSTSNLLTYHFSIHPAVRDGFLSGLRGAALRENHEAVRKGLQVSLGDMPGENPSDPATLDLLEEVIFHSLQSGHVREGWDIYRNRIGGYQNLGWRLAAYERGVRICRAFEQSFGAKYSKVEKLADVDQAFWAYHYALFNMACGSHEEAQFLLNVALKIFFETNRFTGASRSCRMNAEIWLRMGTIQRAVSFSEEAAKYASMAMSAKAESDSLANLAAVSLLRGDVVGAFQYFERANETEERVNSKRNQSNFGIASLALADLLAKIGILNESEQLLDEIIHQSSERFGEENQQLPRCWLQKADISMLRTDVVTARLLTQRANEWAVAHDSQEVFCWSALVLARIELSKLQNYSTEENRVNSEALSVPSVSSCFNALRNGLKIARDCGYGLYHIDLLLVRARLHLLSGEAEAALDDLSTALDDGVPADVQTGQPELLAAMHAECGYAWAIAEGLQLRAEALLLQAAQTLGHSTFVPARRAVLPASVCDLLTQAEYCLTGSLARWQPLHDPEPERPDQNFHLDGQPYNHRAADTHRILTDLAGGVLTIYPLSSTHIPKTPTQTSSSTPVPTLTAPLVFISYSHDSDDHRARVLGFSERLRADGIETILDRYVEKGSPPEGWPRWMLNGLDKATHVLCACTETYYRRFRGQEVPGKGKGVDWEGALMTQSLYEARSVSNKFIPVLFARSDEPHIPEPLRAQTFYVLNSDTSYRELYDAILDQSGVVPGPVGTLKRKPRATGQSLDFDRVPISSTNLTPAATSTAIMIWREKLDYLLVQEAVIADPEMKFRIKYLIDEAKRKICDLEGNHND